MPTNPPTPADRLAAVKACASLHFIEHGFLASGIAWDDAALTALLAADPPGATVTVLCSCGHEEATHPQGDYDGCCINGWTGRSADVGCPCEKFTPTTARVSYTRALTEEERTR